MKSLWGLLFIYILFSSGCVSTLSEGASVMNHNDLLDESALFVKIPLAKGSISGKILDGTSGESLSFVHITTDPPTSAVTTNGAGEYVIENIPIGEYKLSAEKYEYASREITVLVEKDSVTTADMPLMPFWQQDDFVPTLETWMDNSLVAYYPFDGNAEDASTHKNHGVVHGAILASDRLGNQESAYYFDGQDDYIALPQNLDLIRDDFTVSSWIYPLDYGTLSQSSSSCFRSILSYRYRIHAPGAPVNSGLGIMLRENNGCTGGNYIFAQYIDPDFNRNGAQFSFDRKDWYLLTVTRKGKYMTFYINGIKVLQQLFPVQEIFINSDHPRVTLGAHRSGVSGPFNFPFYGSIDDVRIYNRALSAFEIKGLYQQSE